MSNLPLRKEINQRISSLIKDDESDSAFARRCGVSQTTMSGYIKNKNTPSAELLKKISEATDMSLDWLIAGKEHRIPGKNVSRFPHPICDRIEEWLLERQGRLEHDQFLWFGAEIESLHPDFAEYLKKSTSENVQDRTTENVSVNSEK